MDKKLHRHKTVGCDYSSSLLTPTAVKLTNVEVRALVNSYIPRKIIDLIIHPRPHDDVIKWKHFPRYWPFVRGIHRSLMNSPHKGQWRGALMFSLICTRINGWVNNCEAGDLRNHRAHYDVIVVQIPLNLWQSKPDGTKPLPEPMLTYHQEGHVASIWGHCHDKIWRYRSVKQHWRIHF